MLLKMNEIKEQYKINRGSLLNWENQGVLKPYKTVGNHRRYLQSDIEQLLGMTQHNTKNVAIYARVSTKKQEDNLNRQLKRLRKYCSDKGYDKPIEFYEIASGLNGKRRKLHKLIDYVTKQKINHIVVEYKDRLTRFGIEFLLHFFEGLGCTVEFLEEKATQTDNEEMTEDILSIIICFSARLYGKRGGKHQK